MLVSVIVPTYRRPDLVRRCYDSVVAQQHRPLEFVITDDASGDDTPAAVAALPSADGVLVRFIQQPGNRGVSAARNVAIRASTGEVLAFLDSDDVWFPDHLASLMPILQSGKADIVYARGDMRATPDQPTTGSEYGPTEMEEHQLSRCLYLNNPVLPSVTIMTRTAFKRLGWFDEDPDIQHAEDWDLFLRAAQAGLRFQHLRQATGIYVVPEKMPLEKRLMMLRRGLHCLEKNRDHPHCPPDERLLSRGYYLLYLSALLPLDQSAEAILIFRRLLTLGTSDPRLFLAGLMGIISSSMPVSCIRSVARKVNHRLLRGLRVKHRTLRGLADIHA